MTKHISNKGVIYAFEANHVAFALLKANLIIHDAINIKPYNLTSYSKNIEMDLDSRSLHTRYHGQNLDSSKLLTRTSLQVDGKIEVKTAKLDDLLAHMPKVNFFRIDIEEAEPQQFLIVISKTFLISHIKYGHEQGR